MPREKMWVEYDDGAHLSNSHTKPGSFSPLTRSDGSNKLGQVTLDPIEEQSLRSSERSELEQMLRGLAFSLALYALERARPHVARLMTEQVLPAVKSGLVRALSRRKSDDVLDAVVEPPVRVVLEPADAAQEVSAVIKSYQAGMSREEARQRIVAALAARLFSDEQLRILRNARIEDEGDGPKVDGSAVVLTEQQLRDSIKLIFEATPSLLEERELVQLRKILDPGTGADDDTTVGRI
ncbi:hypothetical protein ACWDV4_21090 [Micromonospora sp. NPDC003197]